MTDGIELGDGYFFCIAVACCLNDTSYACTDGVFSGEWVAARYAVFNHGTVTDTTVFDLTTLYRDTGPGLVWLSPIGMMELSAGFPLYPYSSSPKIQFSMGAAL